MLLKLMRSVECGKRGVRKTVSRTRVWKTKSAETGEYGGNVDCGKPGNRL